MQPRKILAVDDSKLMLKMYEMMLRNFSVVFAGDGAEALARLAEHDEVDLVLLDINMPVMNGLEFLDRVGDEGLLDRLTVIIVSTEGHETEVRRGLDAGAAAYITKPFDAEKLLATIAGTRKERTA